MHVASLAADEGFIELNPSFHFHNAAVLHGKADALKHEPGCLLRDSNGTVKLVGTDAILGICNQPESTNPFIKRNGAVFQNGAYTDRKLLFGRAVFACPELASGYFLVPSGTLPSGWRSVDTNKAAEIWGSGNTPKNDTNHCPMGPGGCSGMPVATVNLQEGAAMVNDTPLGYQPPVGDGIYFTIRIDEGDISQPTSFNFSNLGNLVAFNWTGYIEFNPSTPTGDVALHERGAGIEPYEQYNTTTHAYQPGQYTGALLTQLTPTTFVRLFQDGSQEYYQQDDGVATNSGATLKRAFISQIVDPKGNTTTLTYDSFHRIAGIRDAIGQISTFTYGNSSDPYKITQLTDPFGRTALFTYTINGLLASATDAVGLTTTFAYNGSVLNSMTTPYGTTTIGQGALTSDGTFNNVWVQITDPLGGKERAEAWPAGLAGAPQYDPLGYPSGMAINDGGNGQYLQYRTTYYWGKHAMMVAPGDYNAAYAYQYNHHNDYNGINYTSKGNSLESEKPPYASRIWYNYPGALNSIVEGTSPNPSAIGRIVQDASGNNVSQVTLKSYNSQGNVTQITDPAGRITSYIYDTNGIDLLQITQGGQTIASYTYNSQHVPLTVTDGAGQTTTYTYNAAGQIVTSINAKGETTTYTYNNNYLASVIRPLGATTSYTYDAVGRVKTVTDPIGYTVTFAYDNLNRLVSTTYPDGTSKNITYNRLDVSSITDRGGHAAHQWWDANRHLIFSQDPLGRATQYNWCKCGTLEGMTDANGNQTTFSYDPAVRLTAKTYADGKGESYTYDLSGRLSTTTDALGQVNTITYNKDDSEASVRYANAINPTPSVSYSWDATYRRITSISDGSGSTAFTYAPFGSLGGGQTL